MSTSLHAKKMQNESLRNVQKQVQLSVYTHQTGCNISQRLNLTIYTQVRAG